jgi:hypothetical protein
MNIELAKRTVATVYEFVRLAGADQKHIPYEREFRLVDGMHNLSIRTTVLRTHHWLVHSPAAGGGQEISRKIAA